MTDHPEPSNPVPDSEWEALARFTSGESSPVERSVLEAKFSSDAAQARLVGVLREIGRVPDPSAPSAAETELALRSVLARRGDAKAAAPRKPVVSLGDYRSRRVNTLLKIAAAIVVVVSGAGLLYRSQRHEASVNVATVTNTTPSGRFKRIELPDGTKVLLGPGSSLDAAGDYGTTARQVALVGQARFDVVHDDKKPFSVNTASGTFRDIGTVFSINTDVGGASRVVVSKGLVAVRGRADSSFTTLGAGDRAFASASQALRVERAVNIADDEAWTSGRLIYHDAPIASVVADIRRWFGSELVVDPSFAGRVLTATFEPGTSPADAGRVIAAALGGGVQADGQTMRIVPAPAGKLPR